MKVKTSELTGAALDMAVAEALGYRTLCRSKKRAEVLFPDSPRWVPCPAYSTDPSQSWHIIEGHLIRLDSAVAATASRPAEWRAHMWREGVVQIGPTSLIAAMRCFVAFRLGDEVEIPEELK